MLYYHYHVWRTCCAAWIAIKFIIFYRLKHELSVNSGRLRLLAFDVVVSFPFCCRRFFFFFLSRSFGFRPLHHHHHTIFSQSSIFYVHKCFSLFFFRKRDTNYIGGQTSSQSCVRHRDEPTCTFAKPTRRSSDLFKSYSNLFKATIGAQIFRSVQVSRIRAFWLWFQFGVVFEHFGFGSKRSGFAFSAIRLEKSEFLREVVKFRLISDTYLGLFSGFCSEFVFFARNLSFWCKVRVFFIQIRFFLFKTHFFIWNSLFYSKLAFLFETRVFIRNSRFFIQNSCFYFKFVSSCPLQVNFFYLHFFSIIFCRFIWIIRRNLFLDLFLCTLRRK